MFKALGRLASRGRIHRLALKLARKFQGHAPQLRLLQLTAEALTKQLTQLIRFQTAAIGLHQGFQSQLQLSVMNTHNFILVLEGI